VLEVVRGVTGSLFLHLPSLSIQFLPLASGCVPLHLLRPIFLHFGKSERFQHLLGFIFQVLQQPFDDESVNVVVAPWSAGGLVPELKADFRRSLTTHLFGWDNLLSLRMRLSVADLCWVSIFFGSRSLILRLSESVRNSRRPIPKLKWNAVKLPSIC
jgi:hypothetical protein